METKEKVFIYWDGKPRPPLELELKAKLDKSRIQIKEKYSNNFLFLNMNDEIPEQEYGIAEKLKSKEIPIKEEIEWALEDIIISKNGKYLLYLKEKINQNVEDEFATPVHKNSINMKAFINSINKNQYENDKKVAPIKGSQKLYTKKKENDENSEYDEKNKIDLDIYQYPLTEFSEEEKKKAITFLVVGESGSGKTTLINSFINVLMEVQLSYTFRYVIVPNDNPSLSQAYSQTQDVTIYNVRSKNGKCYQIVDTPGYGDSKGINQDKIITEKISKVFRENLNSINAICFVASSSFPRLTPTQKYIFHSIFQLFGEDVISNFIAMLTFCDSETPQVLSALKEEGSGYDKIIPHVESPWYYKFNNSAFFSNNIKEDVNRKYWEIGVKSFNRLISRLDKLEKKTLNLTREVLTERVKLENLLLILQEKLTDALNEVSLYKEEYKMISALKKDIKDSENFTEEHYVNKTRKVDLPQGQHTTTCLNCNFTCHKRCYIADDDQKKYCAAMEKGLCLKCSGKCRWDLHKNTPYIIEHYLEKKVITLKELKKKYEDSKSKVFNKAKALSDIKNNIFSLNKLCIETQSKITDVINRLRKIALDKNILSSEEHIDLLIQSEKLERKEGFIQRIEALQLMKKQKKLMREAYNNKIPDLEKLNKFFQETYEDENKIKSEYKKESWCKIF